jgi:hypothetical protein
VEPRIVWSPFVPHVYGTSRVHFTLTATESLAGTKLGIARVARGIGQDGLPEIGERLLAQRPQRLGHLVSEQQPVPAQLGDATPRVLCKGLDERGRERQTPFARKCIGLRHNRFRLPLARSEEIGDGILEGLQGGRANGPCFDLFGGRG